MLVNGAYFKYLGSLLVVRALVWGLRLLGKADIRCRGCDYPLTVADDLYYFANHGCPKCEGHKLKIV
jgi:hypothetical protein